MGGQIGDTECTGRLAGGGSYKDTGPFIGDRRCHIEASVRHAPSGPPAGSDRFRKLQWFAVALRFARFGPGEEDLCIWTGNVDLASSHTLTDSGDKVGADDHRSLPDFSLSIERIGPEDTGNTCGDGFVEDRRIWIIGDDSIEPLEVVNSTDSPIPVLDVAANNTQEIEARFPHEETTGPDAYLGRVVEGNSHGDG